MDFQKHQGTVIKKPGMGAEKEQNAVIVPSVEFVAQQHERNKRTTTFYKEEYDEH